MSTQKEQRAKAPLASHKYKQDLFAKYFVETGEGRASAIKAGYKQNKGLDHQVARLKANDYVIERVKYYQDKSEKETITKLVITRETQIAKLQDIYQDMKDLLTPQASRVMIEALKEQCKLLGLYEPEKKEIKSEISVMSEAEIKAELDRLKN